ncbi:MAG: right-handed parallel beta-helix repeat-containing protein [Bacteroidales bacterium]
MKQLVVIFNFMLFALPMLSRDLPLVELTVRKVINVDSFAGDDTQKIRAAFSEIKNDTLGIEIAFTKRTYQIELKNNESLIALKGKKNIVINGNDCDFLFKTLQGRLVTLNNCSNIILKNYTIDYEFLPFSQGEVIEVNSNEGYIKVKKDQGYPDFTTELYGKSPLKGNFQDRIYAILREKDRSGMHKRGSANNYGMNYVEKEKEDIFKVGFKQTKAVQAGDMLVVVAHKMVSGAMHLINDGSQITLLNIEQYAGGVAVNGAADCLNLVGYKVIKKPGTNRLQTICRDAFMLGHNKVGPWLEDCVVESNGDDGVNMHTKGFGIGDIDQKQRNRIIFTERSYGNGVKTPIADIGDSLVIYDMIDGIELQRVKIKSATKVDNKTYQCVLNENISPKITFDKSDYKTRYAVFNLTYSANRFVIKNCRFQHIRRHALFLLQASNGIVENCQFIQTTACVLYTGIEHAKSIGYGIHNLQFRNNYLYDCYVGSESRSGYGWIVSLSNDNKYRKSSSTHVRNMLFENNNFERVNSSVFQLSNTEQCIIRNNRFKLIDGAGSVLQSQLIQDKQANHSLHIQQNTVE